MSVVLAFPTERAGRARRLSSVAPALHSPALYRAIRLLKDLDRQGDYVAVGATLEMIQGLHEVRSRGEKAITEDGAA
jgi:hypothetical protein